MKGHLSKVWIVTNLLNTQKLKKKIKKTLDFLLTQYFPHISVSGLQNGLRTSLTGCRKLKGLSLFLLLRW